MKEVATPNSVNRTGSGGTPPCNGESTAQDPHPGFNFEFTFEGLGCVSAMRCTACICKTVWPLQPGSHSLSVADETNKACS